MDIPVLRRLWDAQQQNEYEAEQTRKDKLRKTREATFGRIVANAPATFNPPPLRVLIRTLVNLDLYTLLTIWRTTSQQTTRTNSAVPKKSCSPALRH